MRLFYKIGWILVLAPLAIASCRFAAPGSNDSSNTAEVNGSETPAELALAVWSGAAQVTSGSRLPDLSCPTVYNSPCNAGGVRVLNVNGCETGPGGIKANWTGSKIVTFTPSEVCKKFPQASLESVNTFPDSGAMVVSYQDAVRQVQKGRKLVLSNTSKLTTTFLKNGNSIERMVGVSGMQLTTQEQDSSRSFQLEVTSVQIARIEGAIDQTQIISEGILSLENRSGKWIATVSISDNSPLYMSPSCAFPTRGVLNTSYQGSLSGSTKLEFTGACGVALLTLTNGDTKKIELKHLL